MAKSPKSNFVQIAVSGLEREDRNGVDRTAGACSGCVKVNILCFCLFNVYH